MRSNPVTPANNPKSGNTFGTGPRPRRRNLDLEPNRILAWTAITSGVARLYARPWPLRGARRDRSPRSSRLRVGACVRLNGDNNQDKKIHEQFHGGSPISAWLRPAQRSSGQAAMPSTATVTCVYRKLKLGRSDGEVRQGWRVI